MTKMCVKEIKRWKLIIFLGIRLLNKKKLTVKIEIVKKVSAYVERIPCSIPGPYTRTLDASGG